MIVRRSVAIAAFLTVLLTAQVQAQAPAASPIDELVERFMAFVDRNRPPDSELLEHPILGDDLLRLNPGREADVARIVGAGQECLRLLIAAMPRAGRNAARAMGEERLARLVAFLEGPEGEALDRAAARPGPDLLPEAEDENLNLPNGTEPMADYARWMYSIPNHVDAADEASVTRCFEELFASAASLGLRVE